MALPWTKMVKYSAIGTEFVSPIIVGPIVGHYIDLHFGTDPMFTLVMFLLGLFAGGYNLFREVKNLQRDMKE
jgi:ATP synthase protein I